ncbi:MAG: ABC transporter permease [Candidatus Bathyarchaeota archaeon]|nr:ABC transporter permease [Candidatus Bathyarchaeota archaeon]
MIRVLRQILGVAAIHLKGIQRQPLWIVQSIIGVSAWALTMYAWGSTRALENLVLVYIVAGSWALGLNMIAQSIGWERVDFIYDSNVASPITLPVYFLGLVVGELPYFLVNLIMATAVAATIGMQLSLLLPVVLVAVVSTILGSFVSLSVILRLKNPTNISSITNPLYTLTIFLPPVYYPLTFLPALLKELALIIPTVSLMEIARWITHIPTACDPILSFISLFSWLSASTLLVLKKLKWGSE